MHPFLKSPYIFSQALSNTPFGYSTICYHRKTKLKHSANRNLTISFKRHQTSSNIVSLSESPYIFPQAFSNTSYGYSTICYNRMPELEHSFNKNLAISFKRHQTSSPLTKTPIFSLLPPLTFLPIIPQSNRHKSSITRARTRKSKIRRRLPNTGERRSLKARPRGGAREKTRDSTPAGDNFEFGNIPQTRVSVTMRVHGGWKRKEA